MQTELEKVSQEYNELLESQKFIEKDLDYSILEKYRSLLSYLNEIESSSYEIFDLYKKKHIFFSPKFGAMLGFSADDLLVENEINYDERIHRDDILSMFKVGNYFTRMGFSTKREEMMNYTLVSDFRIRNKKDEYVRVIKHYKVVEIDRHGNAWLVLCIITMSPDQDVTHPHRAKLINNTTGEFFYFIDEEELKINKAPISNREIEILDLISQGYSSKMISDKLFISTNTINTHRQNIIKKLEVSNTAEAVAKAKERQWIVGKND